MTKSKHRTPKVYIALPKLDERCSACGGDGDHADGRICGSCNGLGRFPTKEGQILLAFVNRHLRALRREPGQ